MTKAQFMDAYREELVARYPWATDEAKLARLMGAVSETLHTDKAPWSKDGEAVIAAWRAIGGRGKPTYKALRALPAA
jgi:hypothetical protein